MKILITLTLLSSLLSPCQADSGNADERDPSKATPVLRTSLAGDSARLAQAAADQAIIVKYIADNNIQDVKQTPTGLFYTVNEPGTGKPVQAGYIVKVHYTGRLLDGTEFDSSIKRGEPLQFPIGKGKVIPGWDQGIPLFSIGGKGTLYIPSGLAYGASGFPGVIPPNAVLIFDIEVVDAFDQAQADAKDKAQSEATIQAYLKAKNLKAEQTASGLYYVIQSPGTGEKLAPGKTVSVHYTGKFTDDRVFDASVGGGEPLTFACGQGRVIRGWDEGLTLFAKGGKGILIVPPHLGYGSSARGPIPANSVLVFEVEIVDIQ